jgi:hypothetical protein
MDLIPVQLKECLSAGIAAAIADSLFNPFEVVKVRLQFNNENNSSIKNIVHQITKNKNSFIQKLYSLYYPGIFPTIYRGLCYTGCRIGFYPTIKSIINSNDEEKDSFRNKFISGSITGMIACFIFNPLDLVRIRLQCNPHEFNNTFHGIQTIAKNNGISSLYLRGSLPSILRATLLSGVQLSIYDSAKIIIISRYNINESIYVHTISSLISGSCAQFIIMPIDLLKSRIMGSNSSSSMISIFNLIIQERGILGLWRGFIPAVCRQGPCLVVQFTLLEKFRRDIFGLTYL